MDSKQVEFLVKLRDGLAMASEAVNEYLDTFAPKEVRDEKRTAVQELTFNLLKFEVQQGVKIGEYELATDKNNLPDKWNSAYNILRSSNATIQTRYHGDGYVYGYWLYGEGKIYRQKLKRRENP
jgi:hypothetical protein